MGCVSGCPPIYPGQNLDWFLIQVNEMLTNMEKLKLAMSNLENTVDLNNGALKAELEAGLSRLQTQVTAVETFANQIQDNLTNHISTSSDSFTEIRNGLAALNQSLNETQNDYAEYKTSISSQLNVIKSDISENAANISTLSTKVDGLFSNIDNEISSIKSSIETINNTINNITTTVNNLENNLNTVDTRSQSNTTAISLLQAEFASVKASADRMETDNATFKSSVTTQLTDFQTQITSFNERFNSLENSVNVTLQKAIEASNTAEEAAAKAQEIADSIPDVPAMQDDIAELQAKATETNTEISNLKAKTDATNATVSQLNTDLNNAKTAISRLETEADSIVARLESAENSITEIPSIYLTKANPIATGTAQFNGLSTSASGRMGIDQAQNAYIGSVYGKIIASTSEIASKSNDGNNYVAFSIGVPTLPVHATTKKYVDDNITSLLTNIANAYLTKQNPVSTGTASFNGAIGASLARLGISANDIAYVGSASGRFSANPEYLAILSNDGTALQPLRVGPPTLSVHSARKDYVDNFFRLATNITANATNWQVDSIGNAILIGDLFAFGSLYVQRNLPASTTQTSLVASVSSIDFPLTTTSPLTGVAWFGGSGWTGLLTGSLQTGGSLGVRVQFGGTITTTTSSQYASGYLYYMFSLAKSASAPAG